MSLLSVSIKFVEALNDTYAMCITFFMITSIFTLIRQTRVQTTIYINLLNQGSEPLNKCGVIKTKITSTLYRRHCSAAKAFLLQWSVSVQLSTHRDLTELMCVSNGVKVRRICDIMRLSVVFRKNGTSNAYN